MGSSPSCKACDTKTELISKLQSQLDQVNKQVSKGNSNCITLADANGGLMHQVCQADRRLDDKESLENELYDKLDWEGG